MSLIWVLMVVKCDMVFLSGGWLVDGKGFVW
jgi:hypothetical protein